MVQGGTGLPALPAEFLRHHDRHPDWLNALPRRLERLAGRWSLTLGPPFAELSFNYIAPATRADGTSCVLKVSRHVEATRNEVAALRLWDGVGAARLLAAAPDIGALLIERLHPGTMLVEVAEADDDAATTITAGVLRRLWRPAPNDSGLRSLESWCAGYDRNREALNGGAGGFPAALFQRADALREELLSSSGAPMVLHGDMHHFNVLRANRDDGAGWLAIDPKGLAGDPCFDVCQFLRNPDHMAPAVNRRRLDVFCAELALDRARTRDWCFVHAMLNACWNFEDGKPWLRTVAYAQETLTF